jgi:hypothetical protein
MGNVGYNELAQWASLLLYPVTQNSPLGFGISAGKSENIERKRL